MIVFVPIWVGVPTIEFVDASNLSPCGNPVTVCVTTLPLLSVAVIVIGLIGVKTSDAWLGVTFTTGLIVSWIVIVNCLDVTFPVASVVLTVTVVVPTSLGVPVIVLVVWSKDNPEGRPVTVVVNTSLLLSVVVIVIGLMVFPTSLVWLSTLIWGPWTSLNL